METSIDTANDDVSCMVISTRFVCVNLTAHCYSVVLCLVLLIMEEEKEMIEKQLNSSEELEPST